MKDLDNIYIFSDGIVDQFGGPKGKKLKKTNLKKLLISIQGETMTVQKEKMTQSFESWKGMGEQIDDVSMFGLNVKSFHEDLAEEDTEKKSKPSVPSTFDILNNLVATSKRVETFSPDPHLNIYCFTI